MYIVHLFNTILCCIMIIHLVLVLRDSHILVQLWNYISLIWGALGNIDRKLGWSR